MRPNISKAVLVLLCFLFSRCRAQKYDLSLLSVCAQDSVDRTFTNTACHPLSNSYAACVCRDTSLLEEATDLIALSCGRKDELSSLAIISKACSDEPIRDRSRSYRAIILAFYTLAAVAMASQWIVRSTVGRLQWLDDGNMVIVLALNTLLFATCYKMSFTGLGLDMWNVPFSGITTTLLYFYISEIAYFTSLSFIKISFLLFFLQIFPEKRFRQVVWAIIYFQIASMMAFGLAAIFVCTPISFAWKQWDGEHAGKCINNNALAFSHAAHSIVLDFVTLSLPITQIWRLHLGVKKKIGVLLMFSVGTFVTIVSIIRLRSLVNFANSTDMTWDYLDASLWSVIECQVGIVCACMPSIRLGLTRLFPKIMGSTNQSTTRDTGVSAGRHTGLNTFSGLTNHEINVQTTFRVSHTKKPQVNEDERGFVQLVEIDGDSKSTRSLAT